MPIPDFDHNYVLPPHVGSPTDPGQISPYAATTLELALKFGTSPARKTILYKYLNFRSELKKHNLNNGYQWLDGSFLENIEISEGRSPRDLDLLTIFWGYDDSHLTVVNTIFPSFFDPGESKRLFQLDHYTINMEKAVVYPEATADLIRYWIQLFSHNRNSVWKGMLKINLNTPTDDNDAFNYLNSIL
jgi:hypothetical protein